jgi:hypothetical protein
MKRDNLSAFTTTATKISPEYTTSAATIRTSTLAVHRGSADRVNAAEPKEGFQGRTNGISMSGKFMGAVRRFLLFWCLSMYLEQFQYGIIEMQTCFQWTEPHSIALRYAGGRFFFLFTCART